MIINSYRFAGAAFDGFGNASRDFNGTDQYIAIPDSASFPTGAQTLACWVYVDTLTNAAVFNHNVGTGDQRSIALTIFSDGKLLGSISSSGTAIPQKSAESAASTIGTAEWIHIAMTFEPSTHVKCYKNGTEVGSNTDTIFGSIHNSTAAAGIGANGEGAAPFNGKICDCRWYDADIGQSNIADLANGVDYQTNLIGWWLDDTDDATTDHAGTFATATNNGSTYSTDGPAD